MHFATATRTTEQYPRRITALLADEEVPLPCRNVLTIE